MDIKCSDVKNFFCNRVEPALDLVGVGLSTVAMAALTVVGIAGTVFSVITLGKNKKINHVAEMADCSAQILPRLYSGAMKILNPKSKLIRVLLIGKTSL